jgi:DMSO/TMAO reductase YedYZ molybdopterin-dependent catalytic subunit
MNEIQFSSIGRRRFLQNAALGSAAALFGVHSLRAADADAGTVTLPFANGERRLIQFPQKRPLILLTHRPPQLETPFAVFNEGPLTPNDAFYVRYHLANIPLSIDPETHRVEVGGEVEKPLSLSVADLRAKFEPFEIVAVNQCSGNSRGFFEPRVGGGQWGNGAMGNARWRGVRLKDVLDAAGVKAGARQVTFDGLDRPVIEKTPDLIKSLDLEHARDGEVMIAYEMNGEPLPMLNGFPLRLVVPGWFATYWIKHLSSIQVVPNIYQGYWMDPAYRIPDAPDGSIPPGTKPAKTVPINRCVVRSFITSHADGAKLAASRECEVKGIAFDSGSGIREVAFSHDGGQQWRPAHLGDDLGRYSFRTWTARFTPPAAGPLDLRCRATAISGETQPLEAGWNPGGYQRHVVETVKVLAA